MNREVNPMTATMLANGKSRKTLAEQLDRLDRILDGLAEALNEAVADAVREAVGAAVREAVQATLQEVLSNPALRDRLRETAEESDVGPKPACRCRLYAALVWGKMIRTLRDWWTAASAGLAAAGGRVAAGLRGVGDRVTGALLVLWRWRGPLIVALGVGVLVGVGCYLAGPLVSAGVGGLGGFATALTGKALWWIRRFWPDLVSDRIDI
jgi:hypothetical protein